MGETDADDNIEPETPPVPAVLRPIEGIGARWMRFQRAVGGLWFLFVDMNYWILVGLMRKRIRLGRAAMISQMVRLGVRAVGIVLLLSACIGTILALLMKPPLADWGQEDKIANILSVTVLRELGPLISAVILSGFAGAAVAAEIGTMVVGEEIEALEAHALNPIRFLVVPRVVATSFSVFCLTVFADIAAIFSGMLVSVYVHGVPLRLYWDNTVNQAAFQDFATGLVKGSSSACSSGWSPVTTGSASAAGRPASAGRRPTPWSPPSSRSSLPTSSSRSSSSPSTGFEPAGHRGQPAAGRQAAGGWH